MSRESKKIISFAYRAARVAAFYVVFNAWITSFPRGAGLATQSSPRSQLLHTLATLRPLPLKQNKRKCPDGRICETDFGWVEPCTEYDCDDICNWGKKGCEGTDAPPRPDCEILYCNSTIPPTPTPPSPPQPTPPTPSPSPTPPNLPLPTWKKALRIIGLTAASVLVLVFTTFGARRAFYYTTDRYRAYQERRRRRENFHLRHRLLMDIQDFNRSLGTADYERIEETQEPDSILAYISQGDDELQQREMAIRQEQEAVTGRQDGSRRQEDPQQMEENEPIIQINVAATSARMTRTFAQLKEKTENAKSRMKEKASNASASVKESTENFRKKLQSRSFQ